MSNKETIPMVCPATGDIQPIEANQVEFAKTLGYKLVAQIRTLTIPEPTALEIAQSVNQLWEDLHKASAELMAEGGGDRFEISKQITNAQLESARLLGAMSAHLPEVTDRFDKWKAGVYGTDTKK